MPNVKILIDRLDDKNPPIENLRRDHKTGDLIHFVIFEGGMQSGQTSVGFHFKLADGHDVFIETSGAIFDGMASALRGFELRLQDERDAKSKNN